MKIKTVLTIFYVYYNRSFPQNLNHWLLEKSEVINLQMLIPGGWKNVFSNVYLGFFGADAILGHAKVCDLVLWNCPRRSMTLQSASTFLYFHGKVKLLRNLFIIFMPVSCWILFFENVAGIPRPFDQLPSHVGKVNMFKTPEMRLYFDSDIWGGCLTIIFVGSFLILSFFTNMNSKVRRK